MLGNYLFEGRMSSVEYAEQCKSHAELREQWMRMQNPIPEGAMRVAPGSDAVVWKISPEHSGEL